MQNLLILGSGRSGTSLTTGLFGKAGYFMGDDLISPRHSNPKGFFEDREINQINEDILNPIAPKPRSILGMHVRSARPMYRDRWLAQIPPMATLPRIGPSIEKRILRQVSRQPFCFKDPRFAYTLPSWRPFLSDTRYIVVFRSPEDTVVSTLKEIQAVRKLRRSLRMGEKDVENVYSCIYGHILRHREEKPDDWLFVHYDQIVTGEVFDRLGEFSGAAVDRAFVDAGLRRSVGASTANDEARRIYSRLCELASHVDGADQA